MCHRLAIPNLFSHTKHCLPTLALRVADTVSFQILRRSDVSHHRAHFAGYVILLGHVDFTIAVHLAQYSTRETHCSVLRAVLSDIHNLLDVANRADFRVVWWRDDERMVEMLAKHVQVVRLVNVQRCRG